MVIDDRYGIFGRFDSKITASAVLFSCCNSAACHPQAERFMVVISAIASLGVRSPTEFARPDDERFVQETPLLQVGK